MWTQDEFLPSEDVQRGAFKMGLRHNREAVQLVCNWWPCFSDASVLSASRGFATIVRLALVVAT
jgi:hypothetical protein